MYPRLFPPSLVAKYLNSYLRNTTSNTFPDSLPPDNVPCKTTQKAQIMELDRAFQAINYLYLLRVLRLGSPTPLWTAPMPALIVPHPCKTFLHVISIPPHHSPRMPPSPTTNVSIVRVKDDHSLSSSKTLNMRGKTAEPPAPDKHFIDKASNNGGFSVDSLHRNQQGILLTVLYDLNWGSSQSKWVQR